MSSQSLTVALEVIAAIAIVGWRQFSPRQVQDNLLKLPLILGIIGVYNLYTAIGSAPASLGQWVCLLVGLAGAAVVAAPRAWSVRLYQDANGQWMRRGTLLTLVWWLVALGLHVVTSLIGAHLFGEGGNAGFDQSSTLLFIGVSLGLQGLFLEQRLHHLAPARRQARATVSGP